MDLQKPMCSIIICKESKDNAYNKYTFILNKVVVGVGLLRFEV